MVSSTPPTLHPHHLAEQLIKAASFSTRPTAMAPLTTAAKAAFRITTKALQTTTTLRTTTSTSTLGTTTALASSTSTLGPPIDPTTHVFLTLALLILLTGLVVGLAAVGLVMKTRWDRYQLHMMPLYQFDRDQDLEAELLDSPEEREPVGSKNRRDFGTCQNGGGGEKTGPQLDLL